ncbi:VRR-NUC domain-containing protein [Luteolibacter pohnpeiensis]|uniref:VRR-NUC domain-containing protein n=1 Tax=Luteolibacter pohnpeiensis TaxID=454153 RepID=A0A934VWL8_9BACT|nr:exonuclease domain-containing protein [Luteolibacter pohnpeiensis]MBK1883415.1 VRR-NUC domain-containing protein [Luteolibacter pohnpeiensis]
MPHPFPTLRTFYYLDHFKEMVAFLENHYAKVLADEEREYIEHFNQLGQQAQALKVRMTNRRGRIFRIESFKYSEIPDRDSSLLELRELGFIRPLEAADVDEWLDLLTRAELVQFLKSDENPAKCCTSGKTKQQIRNWVRESYGFADFARHFTLESFTVQARTQTLEYLLFLYFGKTRDSLQAFALRDLGIVKTQSAQTQFEARFQSPQSAKSAFFYSSIATKIETADPGELLIIADSAADWPPAVDRETEAKFHRVIAQLGGRLERIDCIPQALQVYELSDHHPARERICRLRHARGETEIVQAFLQRIIDQPASDEELLFAEDFHARKFGGRKIGRLTQLLREAPILKLDEAFRDQPEEAVVRHFMELGQTAIHVENHFWSVLFGVMFWDALHGESSCATPNEFELRPTQLLNRSFAEKQADVIEARLQWLGTAKAEAWIQEVFSNHFGQPNGIFHWREEDLPMLIRFLKAATPTATATILRRIAADPKSNGRGYPDLLVFDPDGVKFLEIKAEGDQIRRHQLVQMEALRVAGFDVGVLRVQWWIDPMQEYVVVDLETTGRRSESHRVTEIGALKVRNGEVIDQFQTLIHPQRRIPKIITELTGIDDRMVEHAPTFEQIADSFREFVGDAVLVAHNANFDYGFLRDEYTRLGQNFRRPTLCTVVAMRKFYPGLESYKLSRLCDEFSISLDRHHRALCDAAATAELLKLINLKRIIKPTSSFQESEIATRP